jgi:hypothetical protein
VNRRFRPAEPAGNAPARRRLAGLVDAEPIQKEQELDEQARLLYRRYGARPWELLPEDTRVHFRALVRDGVDGQGRPLTGARH